MTITVKDAYEESRTSRPKPPWDELADHERTLLESFARIFAESAVDEALAAVEHLADLETDRQIAKIEADPRKKVVERRRC